MALKGNGKNEPAVKGSIGVCAKTAIFKNVRVNGRMAVKTKTIIFRSIPSKTAIINGPTEVVRGWSVWE